MIPECRKMIPECRKEVRLFCGCSAVVTVYYCCLTCLLLLFNRLLLRLFFLDPCEYDNLFSRKRKIAAIMFKRLIHYQRHGKPVLNPDREAAADPKLFNGTWSPWQVLESDYLVKNANKKIPYPHDKCYRGIHHVTAKKSSSKKSLIPQDDGKTQTTSFLDDIMIKVFKNSNMSKKK